MLQLFLKMPISGRPNAAADRADCSFEGHRHLEAQRWPTGLADPTGGPTPLHPMKCSAENFDETRFAAEGGHILTGEARFVS